MRNVTLLISLAFLFSSPANSEDEVMSPADWYQNHYARVWKENSWDKLEEIAFFYDETLYIHSPDGPMTSVISREWSADSVAVWKAEGWLGSDVSELRVDQLNATTVAFKSKWRDWYADGTEVFSCAWYLADLKGGRWLFTQFADMDCDEHDFSD
jgi:hypothetical protein